MIPRAEKEVQRLANLMSCPAKVCPSRKVSIQKWSKSIVFVLGFVQEYCKLYSQYFCRMSRQGSEQMKLSDSLTCREAQSRRKNEPQKTGRTIRLYKLYSIPMDSLEIQQSQLSVPSRAEDVSSEHDRTGSRLPPGSDIASMLFVLFRKMILDLWKE